MNIHPRATSRARFRRTPGTSANGRRGHCLGAVKGGAGFVACEAAHPFQLGREGVCGKARSEEKTA